MNIGHLLMPRLHIKSCDEDEITLISEDGLTQIHLNPEAVKIQSTKGKSAIPSHLVESINTHISDDGHRVTLTKRADSEWNMAAKNKHPVRWALGLIAKSRRNELYLGEVSETDAIQLQKLITQLGIGRS